MPSQQSGVNIQRSKKWTKSEKLGLRCTKLSAEVMAMPGKRPSLALDVSLSSSINRGKGELI